MKAGDYVRTKKGIIGKIKLIDNQTELEDLYLVKRKWYYKEDFIKSSPNIIDLIEIGDYVNGSRVYSGVVVDTDDYGNDFKEVYVESDKYIYHSISEKNIKSIVTKEKFESLEYKIGD